MITVALLLACAPEVAPATLQAVIAVESGGVPHALHVNGLTPQPRPGSREEAIALARHYLDLGYSVDMGLMQVNSGNLARLDLSVAQLYDPCTNLSAGARVLSAQYRRAAASLGEGQAALQAALSAYNTGNFRDGLRNGYVGRYLGHAGRHSSPAAPVPSPYTADTEVSFTNDEPQRSLDDDPPLPTAPGG
jgi:type IV secretion system protein VirB1